CAAPQARRSRSRRTSDSGFAVTIRPLFPGRAKAARAVSISPASRRLSGLTSTPTDRDTDWMTANCVRPVGARKGVVRRLETYFLDRLNRQAKLATASGDDAPSAASRQFLLPDWRQVCRIRYGDPAASPLSGEIPCKRCSLLHERAPWIIT